VSSTATPDSDIGMDPPVAGDIDMGGSPDDVRADDEVRSEEQVGDDPGEESGDLGDPEGPDPNAQRIADLESRLAEANNLLGQVGDEMERDPEFAARVRQIGRGADTSEDLVGAVRQVINESLEPESARAMSAVMEPILQRLARLEQMQAGMAPSVQRLQKEVGSRQFVEALDVNGVPASVFRSDGFQSHLRALRGQPEFQRLEARSPQFAAEHAAAKWNLSRATKTGNADERSRITAAKNGRSARRAPGSPSLADEIIKIKRQPGGGHLNVAARRRAEFVQKKGKLPTIVYED